jgi:hypothetical protein
VDFIASKDRLKLAAVNLGAGARLIEETSGGAASAGIIQRKLNSIVVAGLEFDLFEVQ